MKKLTNQQIAMKVSAVTIAWNIVLTIFKLIAGFLAHSSAMVSDAIHSASDVFSTVVVIVGVRLSNRQSDRDHQYGHERLECVAAIILSVMLAVTGVGIGYAGIRSVIAGNYGELGVPGVLALFAAIISIVIKEAMYWYTRAAGKKICSGALMADAWHHRSDALSSVGSFIGILGARLGFPILDSVASVVICLFILKVSIDIFKDSVNRMTDKACDDTIVNEIRELAERQEGVLGIDVLKTRLFGDKIYIDMEIAVDETMELKKSHGISQAVHDVIEQNFSLVKHCMVHVNPAEITKEFP